MVNSMVKIFGYQLLRCASVLILFLVVICAARGQRTIDRTIAKVNDDILMESDLAEVIADLQGDFHPKTSQAFNRATSESVQSMFDRTLLVQEARRMGISPNTDDLNDQVEAMVRDIRAGFTSEVEFHRTLAAERLSLDQLKQELLKKTKTDFLVYHAINSQVPSTRSSSASDSSTEPSVVSYRLRRLGIPIDKKNGAQQASREVQSLVAKIITDGVTFEEGVRRYSKVPDAALDGGDLGYLAADKLSSNVLKALEGLEVGHATVPVVAGGYANVFYLEGKRGEKSAQREKLFFETRQTLLERLRRRAVIQIYDDRLYSYLPESYTSMLDTSRSISGNSKKQIIQESPHSTPSVADHPQMIPDQSGNQSIENRQEPSAARQNSQRSGNPLSRLFGRDR